MKPNTFIRLFAQAYLTPQEVAIEAHLPIEVVYAMRDGKPVQEEHARRALQVIKEHCIFWKHVIMQPVGEGFSHSTQKTSRRQRPLHKTALHHIPNYTECHSPVSHMDLLSCTHSNQATLSARSSPRYSGSTSTFYY